LIGNFNVIKFKRDRNGKEGSKVQVSKITTQKKVRKRAEGQGGGMHQGGSSSWGRRDLVREDQRGKTEAMFLESLIKPHTAEQREKAKKIERGKRPQALTKY